MGHLPAASTTTQTIRLGTRRSPLARTQASQVVDRLRAGHPDLHVDLVLITTEGDRTQDSRAATPAWGLGIFVKELEQALLDGAIDLAVHSLKDVPADVPAGLALVAVPEREDPRDALVTRNGDELDDLPPGARVGTSSLRRAAFLRAARPDLACLPVRGNVDTRCRKLLDGQYDAIVLARAGLARLGLDVPHVLLDPALMPPAPGQGALALEARAEDDPVSRLVAPLHDAVTAAAVQAERQLMAELDAGCRLPVGALGTARGGGSLHLLAAVASPNGRQVLRAAGTGSLEAPAELGSRLAAELRQAGADRLLGEPSGGDRP